MAKKKAAKQTPRKKTAAKKSSGKRTTTKKRAARKEAQGMGELPKNYPRNVCAYCGSSGSLSKDHIPPKNLFPSPRPSNLLSVRACASCHSNTSKDDEYFRLKVCLRDDAGDHPAARKNWEAIFRSLRHEGASGLRKSFLSDIRRVQRRTPSGLYVGRGLATRVDMVRIRRVVERTVRGLYFAESSSPLGPSNEVEVYMNEDLKLQSDDFLKELTETILRPLAATAAKVIGDNTFWYRCQIVAEDPAFSVWALTFYGAVPFFCMTGPVPAAGGLGDAGGAAGGLAGD